MNGDGKCNHKRLKYKKKKKFTLLEEIKSIRT